MSLDRDNYYKSSIASNSHNKRNAKSLSFNKTISNKSTKLHSFITTGNIYKDFEITVVICKINLYQRSDFDFEGGKKTINDFYEYFHEKYNDVYSLSSYNITSTSIYNKNIDKSKFIYITLPNDKDLNAQTKKSNYEYIYPLYYIETPTGDIIKYTLNKNLKLIDIGNLKNIIKLWNIINSLNIPNLIKEKYMFDLYKSCAVINTNFLYYPPNTLSRDKTQEYDVNLKKLFINIIKPYFKETHNINIDGWIYYSTNKKLDDEIVLIDNKPLIFKRIIKSKDYLGVPSYDEYKKKLDKYKVKISTVKNFRLILSNFYSNI